MITCALLLLTLCAAPLPTGAELRAQLRDEVAKLPSLVRSYPLADPTAEGLTFQPGPATGSFQTTDGRWPETKGVALDRGWLQAEPVNPGEGGLTIACWFRCRGMGGLTDFNGKPAYQNGALATVGSGYYDGWRIILTPQSGVLAFSLGRPENGAVSVTAGGAFGLGEWHHLACVWDHQTLRLYVDGGLQAEAACEIPYTDPAKAPTLRLGEAGFGVGTVLEDISELYLFSTALDPALIHRLANPNAQQTELLRQQLAQGDKLAAEHQEAAAREAWQAILDLDESEPQALANYHCLARLRIIASLNRDGHEAEAQQRWLELVTNETLPLHYRAQAYFAAGDAQRDRRQYTAAAKVYQQALDCFTGLHENWRVEALQKLADIEGLADGQPFVSARERRVQRLNAPQPVCYVSPQGEDTAAGTKDQPFATLDRARDFLRQLKAQGKLPQGGAAVHLLAGNYRLSESFRLTAEDSGTTDSPIVYRAEPGAAVRIMGGREIRGFQPLADPKVLKILPEAARGKVLSLDLQQAGLQPGTLVPRGYGIPLAPAALELFVDGKPLELARWPNDSRHFTERFHLVSDVVDGEHKEFQNKDLRLTDWFVYDDPRHEQWAAEPEPWIFGYFDRLYCARRLPIIGFDTVNHKLQVGPPGPSYKGLLPGAAYFGYNLLCELDTPGEYYVDRQRGKVYLYPPGPLERSRVTASLCEQPLVTIDGASHLVMRGLTFEASRADGITIDGCDDVTVAGCVFRNLGNWGVRITGGSDNGVLGCDLNWLGDGGVYLEGGEVKSLTPSGHYVENCWIHDIDYWDRAAYQPAVAMRGVANRISHCLIHDTPHQAVYVADNDNLVEFTEFHDTLYEATEMGTYYMYGSSGVLGARGQVVRYSYFHHLPENKALEGWGPVGRHALHIDHVNGAITLYGNVFSQFGDMSGAFYSGGRDNMVENNVFYRCRTGVFLDDRSWVYDVFDKPDGNRLLQYLESVNHNQPPWSRRYPTLVRIEDKEDPGAPENNLLARNINLQGTFLRANPETRSLAAIRDNLDGGEPGFANPEQGDFKLPSDAAVHGDIGFDPLPLNQIGCYQDELRATWPIPPRTEHRERIPIRRAKREAMPSLTAGPRTAAITIDGKLNPAEWGELNPKSAVKVADNPVQKPPYAPPSYVWVRQDADNLYLGLLNEINPDTAPSTVGSWWSQDMVELIFEGNLDVCGDWWDADGGHGPLLYLVGNTKGQFDSLQIAGLPTEPARTLQNSVEYAAQMIDAGHWSCEWRIPLDRLLQDYGKRDWCCFNLGVGKPGTKVDPDASKGAQANAKWAVWVGAQGANWHVWNAGRLEFGK